MRAHSSLFHPLHLHPTFYYLPLRSRLTAWGRQHHYQTEGTCAWRQEKQFGSHFTSDELAEPQAGVSGETPTLDVGAEGMRTTSTLNRSPLSLVPLGGAHVSREAECSAGSAQTAGRKPGKCSQAPGLANWVLNLSRSV